MATPGERSRHLVTENTPKVLRGLSKRALSRVQGVFPAVSWAITLPVDRAPSPPLLLRRHMQPRTSPEGTANRKGSPWTSGHGRREKAQAMLSWGDRG